MNPTGGSKAGTRSKSHGKPGAPRLGGSDPDEELAEVLAIASDLGTHVDQEVLKNPILISLLDEMRKTSKGGVIDEEADRQLKASDPNAKGDKGPSRTLSPVRETAKGSPSPLGQSPTKKKVTIQSGSKSQANLAGSPGGGGGEPR